LGEGSYGKVCLGKWRAAPVALKFCKNKGKLDEFINEMKLMLELPPHPNIVQLFGVSLNGPQPIIIMEYCAGGSLDNLLFDSNTNLSTEQKIRLIRGIALGMQHLHKHNIIHRDLAARNILLSGSGDPRISDFSMSRILQKENEGKTKKNIGPIRWMAPESLANQTYSKKSDVWSFGIVVYEIVAQEEPHTDVNPHEVGLLIRDQHLTPKIPNDCPAILREMMKVCWQVDPDQRPSLEEICHMLESYK
jgi:serine/threonine protein kinase